VPYVNVAALHLEDDHDTAVETDWTIARYEKLVSLLEMIARQLRLSPVAEGIPVEDDLPPRRFFEDYFANRPVILRGLTTRWPARTKWTLEYFAERFGDELVEVTVDRDSDLHYEDRFMFHPQLSRSVLAPRL